MKRARDETERERAIEGYRTVNWLKLRRVTSSWIAPEPWNKFNIQRLLKRSIRKSDVNSNQELMLMSIMKHALNHALIKVDSCLFIMNYVVQHLKQSLSVQPDSAPTVPFADSFRIWSAIRLYFIFWENQHNAAQLQNWISYCIRFYVLCSTVNVKMIWKLQPFENIWLRNSISHQKGKNLILELELSVSLSRSQCSSCLSWCRKNTANIFVGWYCSSTACYEHARCL